MRSVSSVLAFVAATFAFASMSPGVGSATVAVIGDSESFDSTVLRAAGERAAQGEDVLGASSVGVVALRPKTAEITVRYHSVPADAQTAFEAAAAIWEGQFVSSTETIIDVTWAPLDESTLANVRARGATKDDDQDAKLPLAGVFYPSALANAIRGFRLDTESDIVILVSPDEDWYYGTDRMPGPNQFDLVTVALHEIGQGLGFSSRIGLIDGKVVVRGSMLSIYDTFLANSSGLMLSTLLAQDGGKLANAISVGDVYFAGANARTAAGKAPKIYTPLEWDAGSSLSHLDPAEYGVPDPNSLLTPFAYKGWASHDPGPIALAMMRDMGWTIGGLGTPARLSVARIPASVLGGGQRTVDVIVTVRDPIGVPVTSDNTTYVTLDSYGSRANFKGGGCNGEISYSKVVSSGKAVFRQCFLDGYGWSWFRVTADGLAPGTSNAMLYARTMSTVAMTARDP